MRCLTIRHTSAEATRSIHSIIPILIDCLHYVVLTLVPPGDDFMSFQIRPWKFSSHSHPGNQGDLVQINLTSKLSNFMETKPLINSSLFPLKADGRTGCPKAKVIADQFLIKPILLLYPWARHFTPVALCGCLVVVRGFLCHLLVVVVVFTITFVNVGWMNKGFLQIKCTCRPVAAIIPAFEST